MYDVKGIEIRKCTALRNRTFPEWSLIWIDITHLMVLHWEICELSRENEYLFEPKMLLNKDQTKGKEGTCERVKDETMVDSVH